MARRHKRNKEVFRELLRGISKEVLPTTLLNIDSMKYSGRLDHKHVELHRPLKVLATKLLWTEARKWYLRDRHGFEEWRNAWKKNTVMLEMIGSDRHRYHGCQSWSDKEKIDSWYELEERLLAEAWLKKIYCYATSVHDESVDTTNYKEYLNKLLESRRKKITNKLSRKALYAPGTLIEVRNYYKKRCAPSRLIGNISQQNIPLGWFYPLGLNKNKDLNDYDKLVKEYYGRDYKPEMNGVCFPSTHDFDKPVHGIVLEETIVSGTELHGYYCWSRIMKVLVEDKIWILVLHPGIRAKGLGKWIRAINVGQKCQTGLTCKTVTIGTTMDLVEVIQGELLDSLECKAWTL